MEIAEHFKTLGYTQLESEIYCFLLANGINTGYAIAKGINKPAANVYKGLDSLSKKGGILKSSATAKSYIAVDWKELIATQKHLFEKRMANLSEQLESIGKPKSDENVYQMDNVEQVIHDTRNLINNAQVLLLADIEPGVLALFAEDLEQAGLRGVEVRIKAYEPVELDKVHITLRSHGPAIHEKNQDSAFCICADGEQFVTAMLSVKQDSVIQAFRSHSALMNMTVHNYLLYGQVLTELKKHLTNDDLAGAKRVLEDTEHLHPFSAENIVFEQLKTKYKV